MSEPNSSYPLGYSEDEARRLAAQGAFFEDLTGDVLRRAGIGPGMHVLDLGCGVGDVSFLAGGMVGADGTVLGIDRNASSIEKASHRAMALGLSSVRFEVSELETFDNEGQRFDALIGRLVLLYLPDPVATLRRFRNFLRPGGVIAFQEVDMDQISQFPASELFTRVSSWIIASFKAGGAETNMGRRTPFNFPPCWSAAADNDRRVTRRERSKRLCVYLHYWNPPQSAAVGGARRCSIRSGGGDRYPR